MTNETPNFWNKAAKIVIKALKFILLLSGEKPHQGKKKKNCDGNDTGNRE